VIDALVGVTAIETNVGAVTVSAAVFEVTPPSVAVMLLVPAATPVATPVDAIVATVVLDEVHVTELVMFWLGPLE
jgi:hypothetical protein